MSHPSFVPASGISYQGKRNSPEPVLLYLLPQSPRVKDRTDQDYQELERTGAPIPGLDPLTEKARELQREYRMSTYIVLLRGVMPSGKNKVPMAQLREVLMRGGFGNVRTYVQSGNVLVDSGLSAHDVGNCVRELIRKHIGPDLAVFVRTSPELQKVIEENPFQQGYEISRVFFVVLAQVPALEKVQELSAQDFGDEKLAFSRTKDAAFMYIPGPYGRGRLSSNFLEKKLGVSATMRNFNTMSRLVEISRDE